MDNLWIIYSDSVEAPEPRLKAMLCSQWKEASTHQAGKAENGMTPLGCHTDIITIVVILSVPVLPLSLSHVSSPISVEIWYASSSITRWRMCMACCSLSWIPRVAYDNECLNLYESQPLSPRGVSRVRPSCFAKAILCGFYLVKLIGCLYLYITNLNTGEFLSYPHIVWWMFQ